MAVFEIPTRNDVFNYEFGVDQLESVTYLFRIRYNARMDRWMLDVPNVAYNIPVVGGPELFKQIHHLTGIPPGQIKVIDLDGLNRDAERTTLSDRIVLGYQES